VEADSAGGELVAGATGDLLRRNRLDGDSPASRLDVVLLALLDDAAARFLLGDGDVAGGGLLASRGVDGGGVLGVEAPVASVGFVGGRERISSEGLVNVLAEEGVVVSGHAVKEFGRKSHLFADL